MIFTLSLIVLSLIHFIILHIVWKRPSFETYEKMTFTIVLNYVYSCSFIMLDMFLE